MVNICCRISVKTCCWEYRLLYLSGPSGWQSCTRLLTVSVQLLRKSYRLPPGIVCWRAQPKGSVLAPLNLHRAIAIESADTRELHATGTGISL